MQPVIRIEEGYILHAILARGLVGGPSNPAIFCKNRMQCKTGEALDTVLRRYRGGINLLLGFEPKMGVNCYVVTKKITPIFT